ncbi:GRAM domain-containing protein [Clostridium uliginosum]|uniref:GRAM domain-containing protein n=1 Tax=Clostridium uliginosum TaxID=119641 RepID=A0A1I1NVK6_9CLOT|nr:GRAM domain-containing protein [Clostridium uliginosum]SFD01587.1 GRAM domain-containing protein [Clostridium uliginosum]
MNKDFYKTFFSAGIPFGIIMGLFFGISKSIYGGIASGVISGLLFGLILSAFVEIQKKKFKKISSEVTNGKKVIMDGGANHFKGAEGVGGWLYLTSQELIFKSHAFNVQKHETMIPLEQIIEVKTVSTLGLIPNGLQIVISGGIIEKFVVTNRKTWVKKLNDEISSF